jgi:hypothetical protein
MQIYRKLSWFKKVQYPRVAAGRYVWIESKLLCRDIITSLEVKEKILLTTWNTVGCYINSYDEMWSLKCYILRII